MTEQATDTTTRFEIAEATARIRPLVRKLEETPASRLHDWFAEHGIFLPDLIALLREVDHHTDALMEKLIARSEHPSALNVIDALPSLQAASRQHAIFFALALGLELGRNGL